MVEHLVARCSIHNYPVILQRESDGRLYEYRDCGACIAAERRLRRAEAARRDGCTCMPNGPAHGPDCPARTGREEYERPARRDGRDDA